MALSNKFGSLLLTTGNKSEIAVGYCTLYGDMSGGLAVISDVPKTMVYRLARWFNRTAERIPQRVLSKAPSAELRPNQTDQDTLPAYDVLDEVLQQHIEHHESAAEIMADGTRPRAVRQAVRGVWIARNSSVSKPRPALKSPIRLLGLDGECRWLAQIGKVKAKR